VEISSDTEGDEENSSMWDKYKVLNHLCFTAVTLSQ
jgi:hypothetical protein